ncbi:hypothetical protein UPYG_G00059070 [Umbra pygmaea]|uniref:Uncharacterized protein n=1 Tax=Umbra pygmaea TaxID=75934 RepID=A0ABD0XCP5_UMBPY
MVSQLTLALNSFFIVVIGFMTLMVVTFFLIKFCKRKCNKVQGSEYSDEMRAPNTHPGNSEEWKLDYENGHVLKAHKKPCDAVYQTLDPRLEEDTKNNSVGGNKGSLSHKKAPLMSDERNSRAEQAANANEVQG